jgi:ElaB/YqjD/DUF883 family membrane-anchored ribosome-binding protein
MSRSDLSETVHDFGAAARRAAERGVHEVERAGESLSEAASKALDRGEIIAHDVEDFIIHRPWISTLIAIGVGILIGSILRPVRYKAAPARQVRRTRRK